MKFPPKKSEIQIHTYYIYSTFGSKIYKYLMLIYVRRVYSRCLLFCWDYVVLHFGKLGVVPSKKKHLATKKQPLCFEHPDFSNQIHLRNLTYIPKMATFKRSHHFQTIIVGLHISFQGCVCSLSFFLGGGGRFPMGIWNTTLIDFLMSNRSQHTSGDIWRPEFVSFETVSYIRWAQSHQLSVGDQTTPRLIRG